MARTTVQRQLTPQAAEVSSNSQQVNMEKQASPEPSERPVREKLRQTSIAGEAPTQKPSPKSLDDGLEMGNSAQTELAAELKVTEGFFEEGDDSKPRGRARRKRSHDDMNSEDELINRTDKQGKQSRKRSKEVMSDARQAQHAAESLVDDDRHVFEDINAPDHEQTLSDNEDKQLPPPRPLTPVLLTNTNMVHSTGSLASPKNKRNRDQYVRDQSTASSAVGGGEVDPAKVTRTNGRDSVEIAVETVADEGERKIKRHRDRGSPSDLEDSGTNFPITHEEKGSQGGFGNTSLESPFGGLLPAKGTETQTKTSSSAFAASGFSVFASSSTSPFAVSAGKTSSLFRNPTGMQKSALSGQALFPNVEVNSTSSDGAFVGGLGKDGKDGKDYYSTSEKPSALGQLGNVSGFGTLSGGLTSFASDFGGSFRTKSCKPIGFSSRHEDDGDKGRDTLEVTASVDEKQDERFYSQDIETGEENETQVFTCRGKLYAFIIPQGKREPEWVERGVGVLKLNSSEISKISRPSSPQFADSGKDSKQVDSASSRDKKRVKARLLMRADGSGRVMLNSPVLKEIKFTGTSESKVSKDGRILFHGTIDEKPELEKLQLKMKYENAEELWKRIKDLQDEM